MAARLARQIPGVDASDLLSHGLEGLLQAARSFDPSRGFKFPTFAMRRIDGAMRDGLRANDAVTRNDRQKQRRVLATRERLLVAGQAAGDDALLAALDSPQAAADLAGCRRALYAQLSVVETRGEGNDREPGVVAEVSPRRRPTAEAEHQDLRREILRGCNQQERLLMCMYYFDGATMKEIGRALEVSESRISQMHSEILFRLRDRLAGRAQELFEMAS